MPRYGIAQTARSPAKQSGLAGVSASCLRFLVVAVLPAMSSDEFAVALAHFGYSMRVQNGAITMERRRDGRVVVLDREPLLSPEKLASLLQASDVTSQDLLTALDGLARPLMGTRELLRGTARGRKRGEDRE